MCITATNGIFGRHVVIWLVTVTFRSVTEIKMSFSCSISVARQTDRQTFGLSPRPHPPSPTTTNWRPLTGVKLTSARVEILQYRTDRQPATQTKADSSPKVSKSALGATTSC